jgi:hypothetical protein
MKQTAVEWLQEALMTSENAPNYNQWAFKKAKEMEKKQLKEAYNSDRPNLCAFTEGTAFKEYYKIIFKSK